jgi:hypothetical protein
MTVIELGEVTSAPDDDNPGVARELGLDRRLIRRLAPAAVAILCALTVTGSGQPAPPPVRILWRVPFSDVDAKTVTEDSAYVYRSLDGAGVLTAYDLATGRARWTRGNPDTEGWLQPAPEAGLLLMAGDRQTVDLELGSGTVHAGEFVRETVALNAATGAEVWRAPGEAESLYRDTALMADHDAKGEQVRVRMIRLRDHSTIWTRATPGVRNWAIANDGDRPDKIVMGTATGRITTLRYADGAVLGTGAVPWAESRPEDGVFTYLSATKDVLLANRTTEHHSATTAYRLDTMAQLWWIGETRGFPFDCTPGVCVDEGPGLASHEPLTGRRLWLLPGVAIADPIGDSRLLVGDGAEEGQQSVVDAVTGAMIGEPAFGALAYQSGPRSSALVLRSTSEPPGRTSVTRWDLRTGRLDVLGTTDRVDGNRCEAVTHYLTCVRANRFEVTAVD